jgi:hypothetical protein
MNLSNVHLANAVSASGESLAKLCQSAQAVALFGSRAVGCSHDGSDWDLLCVGGGSSFRSPLVDVVVISPLGIERGEWLGSDLAGHILVHGIWLIGTCPWNALQVRFDLAARRKAARLARKVVSLERSWSLLGERHRVKHMTQIRRDLQRLGMLERERAVPPTAYLDATNSSDDAGQYVAGLRRFGGSERWSRDAIASIDER